MYAFQGVRAGAMPQHILYTRPTASLGHRRLVNLVLLIQARVLDTGDLQTQTEYNYDIQGNIMVYTVYKVSMECTSHLYDIHLGRGASQGLHNHIVFSATCIDGDQVKCVRWIVGGGPVNRQFYYLTT